MRSVLTTFWKFRRVFSSLAFAVVLLALSHSLTATPSDPADFRQPESVSRPTPNVSFAASNVSERAFETRARLRPEPRGDVNVDESAPGASPANEIASADRSERSSAGSAASAEQSLGDQNLSSLSLDPVRAARAADILLDEFGRESIEPRNYSAAVTDLLSSLGYRSPSGAGKRISADIELTAGIVGEYYCAQLLPGEAAVPELATLASGFYPKGLTVQREDASLCGTPTESGIFRFVVSFQDGFDALSEKSYRLVISEPEEEEKEGELRITTDQLDVAQLGAEYSFQLSAEGGARPYRWEVTGLPTGIEFDSATGLVSGSPEDKGEFPIAAAVVDANGDSVSLPFSLLVRATPVFITSYSLAEGSVGQLYQERLTAQGGTPPYTWSISSEIPAGIGFTGASGVFEGQPEREFNQRLRITVVDADRSSDTAELSLVIRPNAVQILTRILADGFEDRPYSFSLGAKGGSPPYQWSAGGLPAGLALLVDGTISGTPATVGEFSVSLAVEDSVRQQATRTARIRITQSVSGGNGQSSSDSSADPLVLPGITNFEAVPSDSKAGLVWTNPIHPGFLRTVVTRIDSGGNQVTIYSGTSTTALDGDLQNGTAVRYEAAAEYATGTEGTPPEPVDATVTPAALSLTSAPDPFVDRVVSFSPLDPQGCFGCAQMPNVALGGPHGGGEFQGGLASVVSLGARINSDSGATAPYGGSMTLAFDDNIVTDGPGVDFTVFENAFRLAGTDDYFVEPAVVEVSADGDNYYRFPVDFVPHFGSDGSLNLYNPFSYAAGFAGVKPVYANGDQPAAPAATNTVRSGGDQFDLASLPGKPLRWIRYVRITSTGGDAVTDMQGESVPHSNRSPTFEASGRGNSGFDFDAVAAVNY